MQLIQPTSLYDEQIERLSQATEEQRLEFEEVAAHYEFDCGEHAGNAERRAYCEVQWKHGWNKQSLYPAFKSPLDAK